MVSSRETALEVEGEDKQGKSDSNSSKDYAHQDIQTKIAQDKAEKKAKYERDKENEKMQRMARRKEKTSSEPVTVER